MSGEGNSNDGKKPDEVIPPKAEENPWTPEAVENLVKLIDTLAKEYLQFRREDSQAKYNRLAAVTLHNRRLVYSMVGFLAAIVGLMSALTAIGKVSGDALLFLAGTITGYVLITIQNFVESPVEEPPPQGSSD